MKYAQTVISKIKYLLRKLTEKPLVCFAVSAVIIFCQYFMLDIIPSKLIGVVLFVLFQCSSLALCSKSIVFAANACSLKIMIFLFMVYFIMTLIVLVSVPSVIVMRFLGA